MTGKILNNLSKIKSNDAFCRFIPTRWRQSTLALPLEVEGLLIRISAFNMETGVPLPACRTTAARMMGIHRNKLDKVLAILLDHGEVAADENGISSPRAIAEFKRSQRYRFHHNEPQTYPADTPEIPQTYPVDTPPVEAEKSEQILRAFREDKIRREEKRGDYRPSHEQAAARDDGRMDDLAECKSAFNGSTEAMIVEVEHAMGGHCRKNAQQWLANLLRTHGQGVVSEAFQRLLTAKAEGAAIVHVLRYWDTTARNIKREASRPAKGGPKPGGVWELLQQSGGVQ